MVLSICSQGDPPIVHDMIEDPHVPNSQKWREPAVMIGGSEVRDKRLEPTKRV